MSISDAMYFFCTDSYAVRPHDENFSFNNKIDKLLTYDVFMLWEEFRIWESLELANNTMKFICHKDPENRT